MCGPLAVRIWERSSSKSMSRTDPVQAVFDAPVAADDGRELGGSCLSDGQRGPGTAGPGGPLLLPARLPPAHDLDGLGVREGQASIGGDGPDGAFLGPTVAPGGLGVAGRVGQQDRPVPAIGIPQVPDLVDAQRRRSGPQHVQPGLTSRASRRPMTPAPATTMMTRLPSAASRASVPPVSSTSSSGGV